MTEPSMAIGFSLEEIDALLDLIAGAGENTPLMRLLQHRLWSLRIGLLQKILRTGAQADQRWAARALDDEIESRLRLVTD